MRRRRAWLALVAALGAAVAAGWVTPAGAASVVTVAPGYDQLFAPTRSFPVRVSVHADRLVRGSVVVTSRMRDGRRAQVSLPVEVPGGSTKGFLLVVPPQVSLDGGGPEVTARLVDRGGGEVATSAAVSMRPSAGQEVVGLLPGALAGRPLPGLAPLAVDAGVARFVPVGPDELAQAPFALEPLGALGLAEGELSGLAPSARDGVLRWVSSGGRLLVDSAPGARVEGLPDAWQPGAEGRAAAGRGEVMSTGGAMASGRWAGLLEPTAGSGGEDSGKIGGLEFGRSSVGDALASDAGLRVPELGWLLAFLFVYVAVVGPGTAIVLRRFQRAELAWVVIPLVAVLFTTGSYVSARSLRTGVRLASGTVVELSAAGASATSYVGVAARSGHTARVAFGPAWLARANPTGSSFATAVSASEVTADGVAARLPLDAGQFGVVRGDGPVELAGGLDVAATSDGNGRARGTVTNRLPFALDDVVVLVADAGALVGSLASGEERQWAVEVPPAAGPNGNFGPVELRLWGQRRFDRTSRVNFALWQAADVAADPSSRGPGVVLVAGWTRELLPPVTVDRAPRRPVGRTAVIGRAPVRPAGAPLSDLTIRRDVVRGGIMGPFPERGMAFAGGRNDATVARFTLPSGAPARPLLARLPLQAVPEAWIDGAWTALRPVGRAIARPVPGVLGAPFPVPPGAPVPPVPDQGATTVVVPASTTVPPPVAVVPPAIGLDGAVRDYEVPAAAVQGGRVFLRVWVGPNRGPLDSSFTLREAP